MYDVVPTRASALGLEEETQAQRARARRDNLRLRCNHVGPARSGSAALSSAKPSKAKPACFALCGLCLAGSDARGARLDPLHCGRGQK